MEVVVLNARLGGSLVRLYAQSKTEQKQLDELLKRNYKNISMEQSKDSTKNVLSLILE
jgi:hypothetical protein